MNTNAQMIKGESYIISIIFFRANVQSNIDEITWTAEKNEEKTKPYMLKWKQHSATRVCGMSTDTSSEDRRNASNCHRKN